MVMTVDYGNSVHSAIRWNGESYDIYGVYIAGTFLPTDLIKKLYESVYNNKLSLKNGQCKVVPDKNIYEYYQWDGNFESIKNVGFLKDTKLVDYFEIGGSGFGRYHLDYCENEIVDIYPGDYIVNKHDDYNGLSISIYNKEKFEEQFIYK